MKNRESMGCQGFQLVRPLLRRATRHANTIPSPDTLKAMALALQVNGDPKVLETLAPPASLDLVIAALDLHAGRVAVEHNGEIVPRSQWPNRQVNDADKLEVVHFVGGGSQTESQ